MVDYNGPFFYKNSVTREYEYVAYGGQCGNFNFYGSLFAVSIEAAKELFRQLMPRSTYLLWQSDRPRVQWALSPNWRETDSEGNETGRLYRKGVTLMRLPAKNDDKPGNTTKNSDRISQ